MNPPLTDIRQATAADFEDIYEAHRNAVQYTCARAYDNATRETWLGLLSPDSYAEALQSKELWVVAYKGNIQGFFQLDLHQGELDALYVHPFVQNQGLGTAMLHQAEDLALAAGVADLKLFASLNSKAFYKLNGYDSLGQAQLTLSPSVAVACTLMRKRLNAL
ncbi:GNAT family N-acetyltransferase [Neisseriaceae bacterium CLB008]|nr:GNAT family N-acetyltransferase [Neisseriaceae bacterium]